MKVLIGVPQEDGSMAIVGNETQDAPMLFDTAEEAHEFASKISGLPAGMVSLMFAFIEATEQEVEDLIKRSKEQEQE